MKAIHLFIPAKAAALLGFFILSQVSSAQSTGSTSAPDARSVRHIKTGRPGLFPKLSSGIRSLCHFSHAPGKKQPFCFSEKIWLDVSRAPVKFAGHATGLAVKLSF